MLGFPASFRSLRSQRSARLTWSGGFEPERRPVPGYILFRDGLRHGRTDYPAPGPDMRTAGERFGAAPGFQRQIRRHFAVNVFRRADA